MKFFKFFRQLDFKSTNSSKGLNLRVRMLAAFIPVVIVTLAITGYFTYQISTRFLRVTLENEGRIHVVSLSHEIELFLDKCRKDLSFIAQEQPNPANLGQYLATFRKVDGMDYRILAFISQRNDDHAIFVAKEDGVQRIQATLTGEIKPNLFSLYEHMQNLKAGETWISKVRRTEYPFPLPENPNFKLVTSAIYFATTSFSTDGRPSGYFILAVDLQDLEKILESYRIRDSRIPPFPPEGAEARYSYFFDTDGWILFDSGNPADANHTVGTDLARYGYTGILGNPDHPSGFKPDVRFKNFWGMIDQVRRGKYGSAKTENLEAQSPIFKEHFCAYAPVFVMNDHEPPVVYGGVAFVDRSRLTETVVYKQIDVMLLITLAAIVLLSLVIFSLAHYITRPLFHLTRAVDSMQQTGRFAYLEIPPRAGYEVNLLKDSINAMITKLSQQLQQIRVSERRRMEADLRLKAEMENEDSRGPAQRSEFEIAGIIGTGAMIESLKAEILKAARVEMDVLIIGETGTGKQLTAEAIHRYGGRADKPFVCINCGELDENLLLDTLFGHVKGAFTEAKADRKGAFAEANGGVLFLDEIQTASHSVQNALLRAISQRRFKPLGSDRDVAVDVRMIAATNADLKELVAQGKFRQDLYFRLKVLTIHTPSLREIREDIPLLVRHYFSYAKKISRKEQLKMSKGALERINQYDWPGNVRELINCLTRAVVMAEGPVIQSEDIRLETGDGTPGNPVVEQPSHQTSLSETTQAEEKENAFLKDEKEDSKPGLFTLNDRQRKAYPLIIQKGSISRLEYQWAIGGSLPNRTAIYDLQDLVKKGLLQKTGSGPATRYVLAEVYRNLQKTY